jgi:Replication-relaxation
MRVIDREMAKRVAGFRSTTRVNCRLLLLVRARLLRRFFLGTGGGTQQSLYAISPAGAALVGVPYRGPRRKSDQLLVADFFITHQLRVNDIYVATKYAAIPVPRARFICWHAFHEPIASGLALIPDGYFEIEASSHALTAFLEVDLGHESRTVWQGKVESYLQYARSGKFPDRFGHPQFRVLVVTDSDRRAKSLRATTAALTEKIFWFTTLEEIRRQSIWAAIWQRPKDDTNLPLMEFA